MISSSNPPLERGLDTTLLVYGALQGHPGASVCQQFLRAHSGWFTSPLILFEAKVVLTKIYGIDSSVATQKLIPLSSVPIAVLEFNATDAASAMQLADAHALDLTDAVLLNLTLRQGARFLATEDQKFARVCVQFGITPQSPCSAVLRQQIAVWEAANLLPKGLPRILRRVHQWLNQTYPQAAQDFWSQTGGSHLP